MTDKAKAPAKDSPTKAAERAKQSDGPRNLTRERLAAQVGEAQAKKMVP